MVTVERFGRAVRLLDDLGGLDDPAGFPDLVLPALADLVGCDVVTYNEISLSPRAVRYQDFPHGALAPASGQVFAQLVHQHPLVNYYQRTGDPRPVKISDFLDRRRFHALGLYAEFFAKIPVDYQLAVTVSDPRQVVIGIALNRSGMDFAESDREILATLRGPLLTGLLRARTRARTRRALRVAEVDGLAGLTPGERRVLEMVALGRTNQAIAHLLEVSPRTVAKHLEHTYRKLDVDNRAAAVARLARNDP
ncbi:MAG TPA: helix-turn-helix transcriptional regulator [Pseudonocardiaceae bacterium]|jgi:DNA-binding CsgD family transcriptional regulator|nr:helix-turn-helix transcriptional regulator [Pseudonocardiaceae bacterium]